jgi:hypothetical protein
MAIDPRDELWDAAFNTYYDAYYQELLRDRLVDRWQRADDITKVLTALTASGSAVSGWALWSQPAFKMLWLILASIAAVLTIVHASLSVPGRVRDHSDCKRLFAGLRITLETFRYCMRVDPNFPVDKFLGDFVQYRSRYSDSIQLVKNDILITRRLQKATQNYLNLLLKQEIDG